MAKVGSLVVELALSQAKFTSDLGKVVASVDHAAKRVQASLRGAVGGFVSGLAGILSVRSFVRIIEGSIDAADKLNDLSQATGLSVETLGGLQFAAKKTGSDLDSLAKGFSRLNIELGAAKAGNANAIQTFNALGLSMRELQTISLEDVIFKVADRFEEWETNSNKAVIGNRLFKKSYQDLIPFFNQGSAEIRENIEYVRRYGAITTEVAQKADAFKDTIEKVNLLNQAFATTIATNLVPSMDALANKFAKASEEGNGFKETAETIASAIRGIFVAGAAATRVLDGLGRLAGASAATAALAFQGEFKNAARVIEDFHKDNTERAKRFQETAAALLDPPAFVPNKKPRKPDAPGISDDDGKSLAKRILDGQLKGLDDAIREEQDLLKVRERFLQDYFQDDLIAFDEYFGTRRRLIFEALDKEVAAYKEEIRLLREAQGKATKSDDREQFETSISEAVSKRSKAEREAAYASANLFRDQTNEANKFRDAIEDIGLELARLSGRTADAAIAAFDRQYERDRKKFELLRNSSDEDSGRLGRIGLDQLDNLRKQVGAQAQLNELQERFGQTLEGLGLEQSRIQLDRQTGALSELAALGRTSEANKAIIEQLREWERQMAAVVATTDDPKMRLALEQVRLKIKEIESETDLVGDKFRSIFSSSFTDALSAAIDGTKSLKDAFKDMTNSIVQQINRIAAQNISEALFSSAKGGGGNTGLFGGFIGDFFKGIFGGGGFTVPGFATGTNFAPGGLALVGERGKELVYLPRGSQVVPNHRLRDVNRPTTSSPTTSSPTINVVQNFSVSGPIDTRSQEQIAAASYRGMLRARRIL
jgi:hypothetical protein